MHTVIYLDILLAVNFILDFFLLQAAGKICGDMAGQGRVLAASGLASLFSLVLLLPPMPVALQLIVKFSGSAVPVLVAFRQAPLRQMVKRIFWFFFFNLILAGAVFFWCVTLSPTGVERNNLAVYFNISPITLVLSVLAVYLAFCLFDLLFGNSGPIREISVALKIGKEWIRFQAMLDTGLSVKDPLTGMSCLLLSYPQVRTQLEADLRRELDDYFDDKPPNHYNGKYIFRVIPCHTVGGQELLPAYRCEQCVIEYGGKSLTTQKAMAAFMKLSLPGQAEDGLIGPDMMESIL